MATLKMNEDSLIIQIKDLSKSILNPLSKIVFEYMDGLVLENRTESELKTKNTTFNGHKRKRMQ